MQHMQDASNNWLQVNGIQSYSVLLVFVLVDQEPVNMKRLKP